MPSLLLLLLKDETLENTPKVVDLVQSFFIFDLSRDGEGFWVQKQFLQLLLKNHLVLDFLLILQVQNCVAFAISGATLDL